MSDGAFYRTLYFIFGWGLGAFFGMVAMSVGDGLEAWAMGGIAFVGMTFAVAPWRNLESEEAEGE